ncbi:MAG: cation:proton antiporter [Armatimonadetes bacterium]|nr:cation:proton antiporter [Armatimonadota bacterium]
MILSFAIVVLASLLADHVVRRLRLPGLLGMMAVGMAVGPYGLKLLSPDLLHVSADLRRLALVVILLRAGLMISRQTLNTIGGRVLLMALVPSALEGTAVALVAPRLLGLSAAESMLLGAVVAAVSPAVVVPAMIDFLQSNGTRNRVVPTLLLAASPLDNVFVIVVFGSLLAAAEGAHVSAALLALDLPLALLTGAAVGWALGEGLYRGFRRFDPRATKRVLIVISIALVLVSLEATVGRFIPFSALTAVMALGYVLLERSEAFAHEISSKLNKIWIMAEILLFVLIGAQVDVHLAWRAGLTGALIVLIGLVARSVGVWLSLLRSRLRARERVFCVLAYVPKATVQAVIGAAALTAGLPGGELILAVAVVAVILTAPVGAAAIWWLGPQVLADYGGTEYQGATALSADD